MLLKEQEHSDIYLQLKKEVLSVTKLLLCLFPFQRVSKHFWCLLSGLHITFSVSNNGILEKLSACGSKDYCCFHLKHPKALLSQHHQNHLSCAFQYDPFVLRPTLSFGLNNLSPWCFFFSDVFFRPQCYSLIFSLQENLTLFILSVTEDGVGWCRVTVCRQNLQKGFCRGQIPPGTQRSTWHALGRMWSLFLIQAQSCVELLWGITLDLPVVFGQLEIYCSIHYVLGELQLGCEAWQSERGYHKKKHVLLF